MTKKEKAKLQKEFDENLNDYQLLLMRGFSLNSLLKARGRLVATFQEAINSIPEK